MRGSNKSIAIPSDVQIQKAHLRRRTLLHLQFEEAGRLHVIQEPTEICPSSRDEAHIIAKAKPIVYTMISVFIIVDQGLLHTRVIASVRDITCMQQSNPASIVNLVEILV